MRKRKNHIALSLLLTLATIFTLSGCGSTSSSFNSIEKSSDSYSSSYDSYDYNDYGYSYENDYYGEEAIAESSSSDNKNVESVATNRKLIKTVSLSIETENLNEFTQLLDQKVSDIGGYIEESDVYGQSITYGYTQHQSATYTIRVPQDKLDEFVVYLDKGFNITRKNENVSDITMTYNDSVSRKETLETERERLLELLEEAQDLSDVILLEDKLSEVEYNIDSLRSTLTTYDNLVAYSTIRIDVSEVERYTPVDYKEPSLGEKISREFIDSIDHVKDTLSNFIVWLLGRSPIIILNLVIIGIIILIVKFIVKRVKRKRKNKVVTPATGNPYSTTQPTQNTNTQSDSASTTTNNDVKNS